MLAFLTVNRDEARYDRPNRMNPRSLFEGAPQNRRATEETPGASPLRAWLFGVVSCWCNLDVVGGGMRVLDKVKSLRKSWRQVSRQNVRDEIVKSPDIMVQCMAANMGNKFHA